LILEWVRVDCSRREGILNQRQIVTIDGLAASGKSTLAKLLARELGFLHLNTGLLYRACAYLALGLGLDSKDKKGLLALIDKHSFSFEGDPEKGSGILIDGEACQEGLQSEQVSSYTSQIAALPALRLKLKALQTSALEGKNIVAEGRDTGTVIFPEAIAKFFVEGDPLIRATRRAKDLMGALSESELQMVIQSVAQDLQERDQRDSSRDIAPLKKAEDAIVIDNTSGTLESTVLQMAEEVKSRLAKLKT
jgi:cytidylate kinase